MLIYIWIDDNESILDLRERNHPDLRERLEGSLDDSHTIIGLPDLQLSKGIHILTKFGAKAPLL
jgi:hypothetical protein